MLVILMLLGMFSLATSGDFCLKNVDNPYPEPYLDYLLRKNIEKAVLKSGHRLKCHTGSLEVEPVVELLKETPIAYTPQQRVSAYNLELKVSLRVGQDKKTFSALVSYSQPEGGLGDLPKRTALEDAMSIIYIDLLDFIGRR